MASHVARGRSVEASGRTVDEATENALSRLGRSRDQTEVQVIRPASRGVLGFGAHDAIVRVTELVPREPEAPAAPEVNVPPIAPAPAPYEAPAEPAAPREPAPARDESPAPAREAAPAEPVELGVTPDAVPIDRKPARKVSASDKDEVTRVAHEVLLAVLERMGVLADVLADWSEAEDEEDEPALVLDIIGDDPGLLIGRRGETLRDLQYLVRLIVSRRIEGWANIIVDVEGYKQRRARTVRENARRLADRVVTTQRPAHMEPMNPYERRLVHLELRNLEGVATRSTGEGAHRRVGIYPA